MVFENFVETDLVLKWDVGAGSELVPTEKLLRKSILIQCETEDDEYTQILLL